MTEHRERLLAGALTVLKAYHLAGRPDFQLKPWGSFESWSSFVRNAVVWCGLPDPGTTRVSIQDQSDETARGLRQLITALEMIDPEGTGKTAAEIVAIATDEKTSHSSEVREMLRDALDSLIAKPDGRKLGNRLRHLRKRVIDGKYIDLAGEDTKRVNGGPSSVPSNSATTKSHPPHAPHPLISAKRSLTDEDVEHVEDVAHPGVEINGTGEGIGNEELF